MIKHIVFFKWDENVSSNAQELKERLLGLKDKIKQIEQFEVGINFSTSDRAYDLSLISSFQSKEDLAIYAKDSEHIKVIDFIKSINTQTKVVDYEY